MKVKTEYSAARAAVHKKYREAHKFELFLKAKIYRQVNKAIIFYRKKMYRLVNAEAIRLRKQKYQREQSEDIARRKHKYYENNKDKINASIQKYKEENREQYLQRHKNYYARNKEAMLAAQAARMICECGANIAKGKRSRHMLTSQHLEYLAVISPDIVNSDEMLARLERKKSKQSADTVKKSVYVTCECGQQITKDKMSRHRKTARHLTLLTAAQTFITLDIPLAHDNQQPRTEAVQQT